MEKNNLTKEEVAKILAIPGNVRGTIILTNLEYLKKKGGRRSSKEIKRKNKGIRNPD
jgi:hypothetical protein